MEWDETGNDFQIINLPIDEGSDAFVEQIIDSFRADNIYDAFNALASAVEVEFLSNLFVNTMLSNLDVLTGMMQIVLKNLTDETSVDVKSVFHLLALLSKCCDEKGAGVLMNIDLVGFIIMAINQRDFPFRRWAYQTLENLYDREDIYKDCISGKMNLNVLIYDLGGQNSESAVPEAFQLVKLTVNYTERGEFFDAILPTLEADLFCDNDDIQLLALETLQVILSRPPKFWNDYIEDSNVVVRMHQLTNPTHLTVMCSIVNQIYSNNQKLWGFDFRILMECLKILNSAELMIAASIASIAVIEHSREGRDILLCEEFIENILKDFNDCSFRVQIELGFLLSKIVTSCRRGLKLVAIQKGCLKFLMKLLQFEESQLTHVAMLAISDLVDIAIKNTSQEQTLLQFKTMENIDILQRVAYGDERSADIAAHVIDELTDLTENEFIQHNINLFNF